MCEEPSSQKSWTRQEETSWSQVDNPCIVSLSLQEIGLHLPGSIRLATTPARLDEARYQMARQGWNDAPQSLLTPDEIHELHPLLNMDGVRRPRVTRCTFGSGQRSPVAQASKH